MTERPTRGVETSSTARFRQCTKLTFKNIRIVIKQILHDPESSGINIQFLNFHKIHLVRKKLIFERYRTILFLF